MIPHDFSVATINMNNFQEYLPKIALLALAYYVYSEYYAMESMPALETVESHLAKGCNMESTPLRCDSGFITGQAEDLYNASGEYKMDIRNSIKSGKTTCDVGFSFRPKTNASKRLYGDDYRKFHYKFNQNNCKWKINKVDGQHSGAMANE